ncbi:hypothetical protein ACHAWF_015026 [Thalassiosira exigua]
MATALILIMAASAPAFAPRPRRHLPRRPRRGRSTSRRRARAPDADGDCGGASAQTAAARHDELAWSMIRFYGEDMVDVDSNRFYYLCRPHLGERERVHFPMRDLAAAWDATKAIEYAERYPRAEVAGEAMDAARIKRRLKDAIRSTLAAYGSDLIPMSSGGSHLREDVLLEPPTIGHSALLLLGLCDSCRSSVVYPDEATRGAVEGLTRGILSMQAENGAFGIEFGNRDDCLSGIEFFPGEAMLALMSAYELSSTTAHPMIDETTRASILSSMDRAFEFYSSFYYEGDVDVNYNIWQILAFARYHDALDVGRASERDEVKRYILDMCDQLCGSRSWKHQLARGTSFYVNLDTVEIACGLDALAEGIRVASRDDDDASDLAESFRTHAENAMRFLEWARGRVPEDSALGRGGLGYGGVQVLEQRLDVTGHALSALLKLRDLPVLLPE